MYGRCTHFATRRSYILSDGQLIVVQCITQLFSPNMVLKPFNLTVIQVLSKPWAVFMAFLGDKDRISCEKPQLVVSLFNVKAYLLNDQGR